MSDICLKSLVQLSARGNRFAALQLLRVAPIPSDTARSTAMPTDEEYSRALIELCRVATGVT